MNAAWSRPLVRKGLLSAALLATVSAAAGCGAEPVEEPPEQALPAQERTQPARERLPASYFAEDTGETRAPAPLPEGALASYLPVSNASASEWKLRAGTAYPLAVYAYAGYGLFDEFNDRFLRYEERDTGINLGWTTSNNLNMVFVRPGGAGGQLRYGEALAMHPVGHSYVRYGSRSWGINLIWSDTPVYDWELRGGTTGELVYSEQPFRLYNRTTGEGVVYCPRPWGINLAWQSDCTEVSGSRLKTTGYW